MTDIEQTAPAAEDTDQATTGQPAAAVHAIGVVTAFKPAELLMDANYRTDAEATITPADVALAKATAAARPDGCGNEGPITLVERPDGRLRVRVGHRRNITCLRADVNVLGFVAGAEGDTRADVRARIIEQFNENHHQRPTTVRDDTAALATLFDDDMSVAAIARRTGVRKPVVTAAIAVARCEQALDAAERHGIDLLKSAVIAEFAAQGDDEAVAVLTQVATNDPGQFDYTAELLRAGIAQRAERADFAAALEADGYAIWDRPGGVPWGNKLILLRDGSGAEITPEAHAACPGRAVAIAYDFDWDEAAATAYRQANGMPPDADFEFDTAEEAREAGFRQRWQITEHLCMGPEQYGHTEPVTPEPADDGQDDSTKPHRASTPDDQEAQAKQARRRVITGNQLWEAATVVRRRNLAAAWAAGSSKNARKTPPAGALKQILLAVARGDFDLVQAMGRGHELARELLRLPDEPGALIEAIVTASDKRAVVIGLAMDLAAQEVAAGNKFVWRTDDPARPYADTRRRVSAYLATLREWVPGHELSPIEAAVAAGESFDPLTAATGETQATSPGNDELTPATADDEDRADDGPDKEQDG